MWIGCELFYLTNNIIVIFNKVNTEHCIKKNFLTAWVLPTRLIHINYNSLILLSIEPKGNEYNKIHSRTYSIVILFFIFLTQLKRVYCKRFNNKTGQDIRFMTRIELFGGDNINSGVMYCLNEISRIIKSKILRLL